MFDKLKLVYTGLERKKFKNVVKLARETECIYVKNREESKIDTSLTSLQRQEIDTKSVEKLKNAGASTDYCGKS